MAKQKAKWFVRRSLDDAILGTDGRWYKNSPMWATSNSIHLAAALRSTVSVALAETCRCMLAATLIQSAVVMPSIPSNRSTAAEISMMPTVEWSPDLISVLDCGRLQNELPENQKRNGWIEQRKEPLRSHCGAEKDQQKEA